jgi:phosphoglycerol transferase MdoB-like AlkP superfamily enzyme
MQVIKPATAPSKGAIMEVKMTTQDNQTPQQSNPDGCLPALFRLYWTTLGNAVLLFFAIFVAMRKSPYLTDALFWLSFFVLVAVRYIDIAYMKGQTSECEPATRKHWYRYSLSLFLIAAFMYVVARILAHFSLL